MKCLYFLLFFILNCETVIAKKINDGLPRKNFGLQYGGSIGLVSGGLGYRLIKLKSNVSIHAGYIPPAYGGFVITSLKYTYIPFTIKLNESTFIYPFNPGAFISYHSGDNFDYKFPEHQYPDQYYWWSTSLRKHLSLSSEMSLKLRSVNAKAISFYAEANTNDLYILSYYLNPEQLSLAKIIKLGFGLRLHF